MIATLTEPDIDIDELRRCCQAAQSAVERNQQSSERALRLQREAGLMLATVKLATGRPSRNGNRVTLSDLGITKMQASRWRLLATITDADFEQHLAARVARGRELTTAGVLKLAKRLNVQREQERAGSVATSVGGVHHGDFLDLRDTVADASVALVLTDPPYDGDSVPLYGKLAEFAERVLIPGGWLVTYCGQCHLPRTLDAVRESSKLVWGHQFCCLHADSRRTLIPHLNVSAGWKAILAFYKPPLAVIWDGVLADVVSGGRAKDNHDWEQPESEAAHFIRAFAPANSLVVDPFCGSGTTLAAAKTLGRRWLGFEIDAQHVATARARLSPVEPTPEQPLESDLKRIAANMTKATRLVGKAPFGSDHDRKLCLTQLNVARAAVVGVRDRLKYPSP